MGMGGGTKCSAIPQHLQKSDSFCPFPTNRGSEEDGNAVQAWAQDFRASSIKAEAQPPAPAQAPALHLKHINVFAAEGFQSPGSLTHMRDVCGRRRRHPLKEGGTEALLLDLLRSPPPGRQ